MSLLYSPLRSYGALFVAWNWFREFRKYHRDDKGSGKIVKRDDHLMDATRYLTVSGRLLMRTAPEPVSGLRPIPNLGSEAWMA